MNRPDRDRVAVLLEHVESELRALSLWESRPPPAAAFESTLPFCADTMAFHQWLQWIFIRRFRALLEGGHPLPENCGIQPMAEEAMPQGTHDLQPLLDILGELDAQFGRERR